MGRTVRFYYDFVSPYSWLALEHADAFAAEHDVQWELRPIVYTALLRHNGLKGPVETNNKARYTFHDVLRCAAHYGVDVVGPPVHPFRSIEALRVATLFIDDLSVSVALARAAWGRGRDLTDADTLISIVPAVSPERIQAQEIKDRLRAHTDEAIEAGVFGVPTFVYDNELFWGRDRMDLLAERLRGVPKPRTSLQFVGPLTAE